MKREKWGRKEVKGVERSFACCVAGKGGTEGQ